MDFRGRIHLYAIFGKIKNVEPEKYLPIIISSLSLIVAGLAFWWTRKYNTSDFRLSQKVKDDTLELLSTLRALHIKAIHYTQGLRGLTITLEKEKLNSFLLTPTAFAYNVWVGQKSKLSGGRPEEWRIFFLRLTQILNEESSFNAGCIAVELEELFDTLNEDDFELITSYLRDIPEALQKLKSFRQYDVAIQAFMNVCKGRRQNVDSEHNSFERKILFLKEKGITDPNIDLFLGILENKEDLVKSALDNGADPSLTDAQLIEKYKDELKEFGQ